MSVVIATLGERKELLRQAIDSILGQKDAAGQPWPVELLVIIDRRAQAPGTGAAPATSGAAERAELPTFEDVVVPEGSSLRVMPNARTRGLAGGRNTGIVAASHPLMGFCDDDDSWLPGKLAAQVALAHAHPDSVGFGGTVVVRTEGKDIVKATPERVRFAELLRSRVHELHPSAMLYRRQALLGSVGLVDEELPHGYGEDYELLLRMAREADIISATEPIIRVLWDRPSYFDAGWRNMAEGLSYLLRKFPEFEQDPVGLARIAGQVAYAHAALGERKAALAWARSALRRDPKQLRAWAALVVAARLLPAATLLKIVQRSGHGL
ncbi:glycosyltransferase family 2 protein [Galactobacter caseinivorans]|uniref:glycosyltransferase family 2 protein n=1 Tax=Galactobacter caseinivorans TaxID=2676123 RepID=UPI001F42AAE5|nr:glycosyltransferase family 2 protein [Galactobacter caseinivorans]